MEPDTSIASGADIRVAVIPVGSAMSSAQLRTYFSALCRHSTIDLSEIREFYKEHQKSPFTHQPWDSSCLRLRFILGGGPASPWEDFQPSRKFHAVVGLVHCAYSLDLAAAAEQFAATSKQSYASALVVRCLAFHRNDAQMEDKQREDIILFPYTQQALEQRMRTVVQDVAASLLMEFEKWVLRAESSGTILKTPLDSQSSLGSEEVIKAKKRRLGRAQKTIGDYCLLAGSPIDANAHYSTAIELARLTNDVFWHAGAIEGSVCALLLDPTSRNEPSLEEEVKYRYYSVIQLYRRATLQDNAQRVSTVSFELEATLKLARYLCRRELAKEVADLLMGAADGAKSLIDANDRLILYVEISRLFGTLGYQRKAAFFSRQVAQLYLQQENASAAMSAMKVLTMTTAAYHVQSKRTNRITPASFQDNGAGNMDAGKAKPQSVVSLFESQWSTLQMVVLREILMSSVRAGDPLSAWSAAARLLRSFYPLITPAGQSGLASSLANSSDKLPLGTRCADPCLPFIRLYSFPLHPSQTDIVKRNPQKKEWWTGSGPSGPFIYTPFSKGSTNSTSKQDLTWIVGEPVQILVELANPCSFELVVESIYLSVHSGDFDAFPISLNLAPNTSKVVLLSGMPRKMGPVIIPGCIVHCYGVITEHLFRDVDNLLLGAAQGLVLSDPFRSCGSTKFRNVTFPNISVVPPLPLLIPRLVGGDGSIVLYEGEIRTIYVSLTNAGTVPVEEANISLSGKNQDSVISIAHDTWKSALPLKPGGEVTFAVTLRAWQLSLLDLEVDPSRPVPDTRRMSREGSSPVLVIHYAGPLTSSEEPQGTEDSVAPGRRLLVPLNVCVVQGLRLVKARLLSMEIPARFRKTVPKSITGDSIKGNEDAAAQGASIMKIDQYKGSWGLRLLELELSNPTDIVFDCEVSVQLDKPNQEEESTTNRDVDDLAYHKTRIDRDYSARVLIPLEHLKLPVLDVFFFLKDGQTDDSAGSRGLNIAEKNAKAELNASIKALISKIKVRWHSGRNSSGELNIRDAVQEALQASVMDILLPDPLTFGFKLKMGTAPKCESAEVNSLADNSCQTHEMTNIEVLVLNNTKETISLSLNIVCRDVAGENCLEGLNATILWAGVLNDIHLEVPPLQEVAHPFSFYFLVPGDYSLQASAVILDATDILRARARTDSPNQPIFCCGSPFHVCVAGAA